MNTTACPKEIPYLATIEFLETYCHIGSVLMLSLSSYSLWLIATKTPPTMKSSVPYMINLHLWTMFCDLTWSVLVLPMFFMPNIAAHGSGVLLWFSQNPVPIVWLPFATLGELNNISIVLFTLHGTSSSIATIFIYAPYRKYTKELVFHKILRRPQNKVFRTLVSVSDRSVGRRAPIR
ncbi:unnamed protein product [Caenorhabditis brenneri]